MKTYQLYIRNMVCDRCIYVVRQVLKQLRIAKAEVELGKVTFLTARKTIVPAFGKEAKAVWSTSHQRS